MIQLKWTLRAGVVVVTAAMIGVIGEFFVGWAWRALNIPKANVEDGVVGCGIATICVMGALLQAMEKSVP